MAPRTNNAARLGEEMTPEDNAALDADRGNTAPIERQPLPLAPAPPPTAAAPPPPAPEPPPVDGEHIDGEPPPADGQPQQRRMVDYGAMKEEREKRKASEKREREASEKLATLAGRFQILEQLASQTKSQPALTPQEPVVPDITVDPVGHFQAQLAQERTQRTALEQRLKDVDTWRQGQEANAQAMNNVQQLTRIALAHEAEFSKSQPEYQKAASYVRDMRDAELQAMGYADPGQRAQMIQNDALNIAAQALNANMNAAEVVWAIAQARGYKVAPPAAPTPAPQPPATPVAPAPNSDAARLKTVAEGQKTGQSIGQLNGAPPPQETLPERLLAMSDKDFEEATKGEKWRQLFS